MGRLGLPGFWIAFSGTYLIAVTENFGFLAPVLAKQSPAVLARSPSTGLWHRSRGGCADCLPVLTRGTNVSILVGWRVAPAAYPGLEHSADFFCGKLSADGRIRSLEGSATVCGMGG
jgi:hypothetical protein